MFFRKPSGAGGFSEKSRRIFTIFSGTERGPGMNKDTYLHIRVEKVFKERLKSAAKKQNRTVANYVLNVLIQAVEKEEKQ